jgi:Family of unknown function (DUF6210)
MSEKRVIDLDSLNGLGLIIQHPSGVFYTNQVGGHGCFHPEVEGVFFPLQTDVNRYELNTLEQHFKRSWDALNEFEANLVDTVLQRSSRNLNWISVDRSRLKHSFEAWIYVKLNPKKTKMDELLIGFDEAVGVLTWPNSD